MDSSARAGSTGSRVILRIILAEAHGSPFDHAVVTAYELFPPTMVRLLQDAGFTHVQFGVCDPPDGARPLDHATVFARKRGT